MREDIESSKKEYKLKSNANILGSNDNNFLDSIKQKFERHGLNSSNITENDYKFKANDLDPEKNETNLEL